MKVAITMANLGSDTETGKIVSWLKQVGDKVGRGKAIAETDKTDVEMEALASGTLVEVTHAAGAAVPVGDVIGYLETDA